MQKVAFPNLIHICCLLDRKDTEQVLKHTSLKIEVEVFGQFSGVSTSNITKVGDVAELP
jgi:hypothetical protein